MNDDILNQPLRERFIPLNKGELLTLLARHTGLSEAERAKLEQLRGILDALIHHAFHERLEKLKEAYAPFDPDHEVCAELETSQSKEAADQVFEKLVRLLERANYQRLSQDAIEASLRASSDWGLNLRVDLSSFDRLEVFGRGDVIDRRLRRRWKWYGRQMVVEVPIYRRLVVVVRRRDAEQTEQGTRRPIYLKMFKNIPKVDINMLLPDTHVQMSWLDQGKIILPTVSGLALAASKIGMKSAMIFTIGLKGLIPLLGVIGGTLGYGARSFFGYLRTKDKYHLSLTRRLYYQNLDNNAGVIFRVLDEAEEQEFAEAAIAYTLLWRESGADGWNANELDRRAEKMLHEAAKIEIDFDHHDAIVKLRHFGILASGSAEQLSVRPIDDVLSDLDRLWNSQFVFPATAHCPRTPAADG